MQVSTRPQSNAPTCSTALLAKWHRGPAQVKVNRGFERSEEPRSDGAGSAPAERWQRAPVQITSDSSFQMPLVKVSIYMSNLRLPTWALVDYSRPSLKSLTHLGWLLLLNWNVPLERSGPPEQAASAAPWFMKPSGDLHGCVLCNVAAISGLQKKSFQPIYILNFITRIYFMSAWVLTDMCIICIISTCYTEFL